MPSKDPRIDAYIKKSEPFARPILKYVRKVVHAGCPAVQETMKWGFPHFTHKGVLCSMAAFKRHAAFGFWKGKLLAEHFPNVEEQAMGEFGRIESVGDLPSEAALLRLVKAAVELNEDGPTTLRPPAKAKKPKKAPPKPPSYLMSALRKNKAALTAFRNFSPSHQREYIEWLTEAKTEETRKRRLATALEWMAGGKPRNWKYMRK